MSIGNRVERLERRAKATVRFFGVDDATTVEEVQAARGRGDVLIYAVYAVYVNMDGTRLYPPALRGEPVD